MTLQILVPSMVCEGCVGNVTAAITALDPKAAVHINLGTKQVKIDTQVTEAEVKAAIVGAGHTVG
jgi:copper chaperone